MEKLVKVERFSTAPSDPAAARKFKLWLRNFEFYLDTISALVPNKLEVLFLHVDSEVAELIVDCIDYSTALTTLKIRISKHQTKYTLVIFSVLGHKVVPSLLMNI